jgi:hypothetical protein
MRSNHISWVVTAHSEGGGGGWGAVLHKLARGQGSCSASPPSKTRTVSKYLASMTRAASVASSRPCPPVIFCSKRTIWGCEKKAVSWWEPTAECVHASRQAQAEVSGQRDRARGQLTDTRQRSTPDSAQRPVFASARLHRAGPDGVTVGMTLSSAPHHPPQHIHSRTHAGPAVPTQPVPVTHPLCDPVPTALT